MTRVVFSSGWKLSRDARGIFQRLETFPRRAWYFPAAGNFPATRVVFSRSWKPSCDTRGIFQELETFPRCAWDFPGAGNLPVIRGPIFGIARRNPYLRGQEKKLEQNGETF